MAVIAAMGRRAEQGRRLIELLEARGTEVRAAVWVYDSDHGGWKLRLQVAHAADASLTAEIIRLKQAGEDVPFFNEVRVVPPTDPVIAGTEQERASDYLVEDQLGLGMYGGEFVEDIYIYRTAA